MKHYLPLYALLAFMPLASCSDDEPTVSPLPEKTYTGNESLELRYNQSPMSGKSVAFIQNEEKATLTMGSTVSPGDPLGIAEGYAGYSRSGSSARHACFVSSSEPETRWWRIFLLR